jgi:hypothetical protein
MLERPRRPEANTTTSEPKPQHAKLNLQEEGTLLPRMLRKHEIVAKHPPKNTIMMTKELLE